MKRIKVSPSKIDGMGIFAEEPIKAGERIQYIRGPKIKRIIRSEEESKKIENWIGAGKHFWIDTTNTPFRYINHSCSPNAAMTGTKTLVALEDIATGEEINTDYSMTDADPHWNIHCKCHSKNCRKEIRAIYTVPPEVFKKHMPYVSKNFQRIFLKSYIATQDELDKKRKK